MSNTFLDDLADLGIFTDGVPEAPARRSPLPPAPSKAAPPTRTLQVPSDLISEDPDPIEHPNPPKAEASIGLSELCMQFGDILDDLIEGFDLAKSKLKEIRSAVPTVEGSRCSAGTTHDQDEEIDTELEIEVEEDS